MISASNQNNPFKSSEIVANEFDFVALCSNVILFISENLHHFMVKSSYVIKGKEELCYNKQLLNYLDRKLRFSNYQFIIQGDQLNEAESYPDLQFFVLQSNDNKSFFDIECKRLNSDFSEQHVSQYVHGKTGGIQRFKENKHGVDLPQSAMIGYIETNDFDFWFERINNWIGEPSENLKFIEKAKIAKLKSHHKRTVSPNTNIELMHFWIQLKITDN